MISWPMQSYKKHQCFLSDTKKGLMDFWCTFDAVLMHFWSASWLHSTTLSEIASSGLYLKLTARPFFYFTKNSYFANKILLKIRRVFDALLMRFSSKCIERAMRCPCIRVGPVAALLQKRGNITWFVHQSEFQFQIYSRYSVWLLPAFCVHGYGRLYTYICIYVCLPREE